MVEKDPQQSVFCPAQRDDSAVIIQQMTRGGIQLPVAKHNQSAGFGNLQIGWQRARAPQDRFNPRQQLPGDEGFDQVVIGAHFQTQNTVAVVGAGG